MQIAPLLAAKPSGVLRVVCRKQTTDIPTVMPYPSLSEQEGPLRAGTCLLTREVKLEQPRWKESRYIATRLY